MNTAHPSRKLVPKIKPITETDMPSNTFAKKGLDLVRLAKGWKREANRRHGMIIPAVAAIAPGVPARRYPRKVATVKIGPGVL
jgi:hypothetical protein